MRRAVPIAVACVTVLACSGCGAGAHGHGGHGGGSSFPTEALATAAIAAVEVAAFAALPAPVPDPDPDPSPYIGVNPGPPGPAFNPLHPTFEPAAALAAIDAVDFAPCRASGALIGWNHARLTFQQDGGVSRVVVDWTPGTTPAARECLRAQLAGVAAPRFEGKPVTIGAAFFVP